MITIKELDLLKPVTNVRNTFRALSELDVLETITSYIKSIPSVLIANAAVQTVAPIASKFIASKAPNIIGIPLSKISANLVAKSAPVVKSATSWYLAPAKAATKSISSKTGTVIHNSLTSQGIVGSTAAIITPLAILDLEHKVISNQSKNHLSGLEGLQSWIAPKTLSAEKQEVAKSWNPIMVPKPSLIPVLNEPKSSFISQGLGWITSLPKKIFS